MTSRSRFYGLLLGLSLVAAAGLCPSAAQDAEGAEPAVAKAARRVPTYFSKVGLTPEQREEIYAVRAKHAEKIEALQKQIDEMKAKEMAECEAVLVESQKKLLAEFRAAGKAAKSKAKDPEKPGKADMKKAG